MTPLDVNVAIDSTTWAALALVLTVLGAAYAWIAWRRRGPAAGLRGLAWALVPVAAWLTGTLRLAVSIVDDVGTWATRLVFSPTVWAGIIVAGVAVLLWVVSGLMLGRGVGVRRGSKGEPEVRSANPAGKAPATTTGRQPRKAAARDDDVEGMDEIEAILKKHGL